MISVPAPAEDATCASPPGRRCPGAHRSLRGPVALALALAASTAFAAPSGTRRLALVAGADDGGAGRARLRYAVSDARQVADVLRQLGGVAPADLELVQQPSRAELSRALAALPEKVAAARAHAARVEVIVYYSGHSDEAGLLLRGERLPYGALSSALDASGAEVRVAILDSCASGAMTRMKGGVSRPAFMLDASQDVRGRAILTATSADEAAQESDRVRGSFFTHYLVSGLRGAADVSRSGRVTLNDAYRFAFAETLARTQSTRAGAQHPAYDIALNGSGDLVLTDLHVAGATLVLPEGLVGHVYVRDAADRLVVELRKVAPEPIHLGLEPGSYRVTVETGARLQESRVELARGEVRAPDRFDPVAREAVAERGGPAEVRRLPVNVSLFPPASVNALYDYRTVNAFAFDLLAGNSAGLDGVQISGLGSRNGDVRGLQVAGLGNLVDGAAFDDRGDAHGVQVAGAFNWVGGALRGVQVAGALNRVAGPASGAQVAGALNVASDVSGAQVAPVNVAEKVRGMQLGVVNVAEEADVSVGVLSWVKQGTHAALAGASEYGAMVEADTGGRVVYGILAAGAGFQVRQQPQRYLLGAGVGWRALVTDGWSLDAQLLSLQLVDSNAWRKRSLYVARALWSARVAGPLAIAAGPTFNVLVDLEPDKADVPGYGWSAGSDVRLWPGFFAGVRLF